MIVHAARILGAVLAPSARPGEVALLLRQRARRDQAALLRMLCAAAVRRGEASEVQSLWIDDSIALRARPALDRAPAAAAGRARDRARPRPC